MAGEKKTILLIEDDRFLRKVYSNKLRQAGFDVAEAINGEEGIHKMLDAKPDFVILDIILPRQNGFDVLTEIKSNPKINDVPVLILSNLGQASDRERGLALGAVDYLIKTELSLSDIVAKVSQYFTASR